MSRCIKHLHDLTITMALRTTNVLQLEIRPALVSSHVMGNLFHPISCVYEETDTIRIAQVYPPPLVRLPPSPTSYDYSLVS